MFKMHPSAALNAHNFFSFLLNRDLKDRHSTYVVM